MNSFTDKGCIWTRTSNELWASWGVDHSSWKWVEFVQEDAQLEIVGTTYGQASKRPMGLAPRETLNCINVMGHCSLQHNIETIC